MNRNHDNKNSTLIYQFKTYTTHILGARPEVQCRLASKKREEKKPIAYPVPPPYDTLPKKDKWNSKNAAQIRQRCAL